MPSKTSSTGFSNFSRIWRERTAQEQGNGSSAEPAWDTIRQQGEALLSNASKPKFPPRKKSKATRSVLHQVSSNNLQSIRPGCFQLGLEKGQRAPKLAIILLVPHGAHTMQASSTPSFLFLTFSGPYPKIPPTSTKTLRSAYVHINERAL